MFCPECHNFAVVRYETRYRCQSCRVKFSLLSHTWLRDIKIPLRAFWLILWCWTKQIPVKQTQDLTILSDKAIRHWFTLFPTHLPANEEILEHIVQLDEAYFGRFGRLALLMGKQVGTRKLAYTILRSDPPGVIDAIQFARRYLSNRTRNVIPMPQ